MKIVIYTDGSSRGNPGRGGWSAIVMTEDEVVELGGREDLTTNNRMELLGAIHGLKEIDSGSTPVKEVEVLTDSQYVKKGMTEWINGWIKRNWVGSTKKPVLNRDLWELLKKEEERLTSYGVPITWTYVRGHAGVPLNERADTIATSCADSIIDKGATNLQLFRGRKEDYTYF